MNDLTFRNTFGMSTTEAEVLYINISHLLVRPTKRTKALTGREVMKVGLCYLVSGSSLRMSGMAVRGHKSTVRICVKQFVYAILSQWSHLVSMKKTLEQWNAHMLRMRSLCGLSHVVGAIDGSYIKIKNVKDDGQFFCRKNFPSINTLLVCDSRKRFLYVNANYPGSCHDGMVFRESTLGQKVKDGWCPGNRYGFLADHAFPNTGCVFPFRNSRPGEEEIYQ